MKNMKEYTNIYGAEADSCQADDEICILWTVQYVKIGLGASVCVFSLMIMVELCHFRRQEKIRDLEMNSSYDLKKNVKGAYID